MATIPSNANKIVSTKDNNYFVNNKITLAEELPTTGTYKMGDIIINPWSVGKNIGWVCTDDGEPGEWAELLNGVTTENAYVYWRNVMEKPSTFPPVIGTKATDAFRGDYGNTAYTHATSAHAPTNAQKNSDITKAEIEAKLIGVITTHTHKYAGSSSAGGVATEAAKTSGSLTIQTNGTNAGTFNGSSNKTIDITPSNIGAATTNHTHSGYASASHSHGLTESTLSVEVENTSLNAGWSMLVNGNDYSGFLLKSIRTGASAPNWLTGNYSSGIAFGGSDTKGVISVAYQSPSVKFAGGNGVAPSWYIEMTGTNQATYNLDNFVSTSYVDTKIGNINTILADIVGA